MPVYIAALRRSIPEPLLLPHAGCFELTQGYRAHLLPNAMLRLAVDTGGTFTDCVLQDAAAGRSWFAKVLSTPDAPEEAVLAGIDALMSARPFEMPEVATLLIATTVATNAILERRGARVGLVTTRGFRDVVFMQRAKRYDTYDLHLDKPRPLVQRRAVAEVVERLDAHGDVVQPLDLGSVDDAITLLEGQEVETVAVTLLHAYANSQHERVVAERLSQRHPEWSVSCSALVSPKYREYERASTTLANAYVTPVVHRFLDRLTDAFTARGFAGDLYVMQSNGGLSSPELIRALPVNIIESGPAAGVLLGGVIGRRSSIERVLTFDMGGTTAKLGAVEDGEPTITPTFEVDGLNLRQWSGLPLNLSAVELIEIGAGGGSIASAQLGIIAVGPESAGAVPGPACYGRGGERPTITDANLLLGYLVPERFAGGQLALDFDAAVTAVRVHVAEPLGLDVTAAAWGIHTVANATMERAMRSMSIERGRDPRDYALVAFGGAGPLHACRLARALGVREVVVPHGAGVGSAVGMLDAVPRFEASVTRILSLETDFGTAEQIARLYQELEARCLEVIGNQSPHRWRRYASVRYAGQGYELRVEIPMAPDEGDFVEALRAAFLDAYTTSYGYAEADKPLEVTEWSLSAELGPLGTPVRGAAHGSLPGATGGARSQRAYFPEVSDTPLDCRVYGRREVASAIDGVPGPAIVADDEATTLIPPGDLARVNAEGDLVIQIAVDEEAS